MIRKLLLTATAFTALSGAALAADLPSRVAAPMPYAVPVFTWTGFYVGASAGFIANQHDVSDDNDWIAYNYNRSSRGGIFGVNAGYNWQAGAFVLGLEADIAAVATSSNSWDPYNEGDGSYAYHGKLSSLGTVRGRAGLAFDRALLYVTGGLAYGNVKNSATGDGDTGAYASTSGWQTGWTVGGGIEYAVTPNWTVRAEALYVDLGKKSVTPADCSTVSFKDTAVVGRVGVNYKF